MHGLTINNNQCPLTAPCLNGWGVVLNFGLVAWTGGGSRAQDMLELEIFR